MWFDFVCGVVLLSLHVVCWCLAYIAADSVLLCVCVCCLAVLKGRGYSEVHLRELTEVILPGLEVHTVYCWTAIAVYAIHATKVIICC